MGEATYTVKWEAFVEILPKHVSKCVHKASGRLVLRNFLHVFGEQLTGLRDLNRERSSAWLHGTLDNIAIHTVLMLENVIRLDALQPGSTGLQEPLIGVETGQIDSTPRIRIRRKMCPIRRTSYTKAMSPSRVRIKPLLKEHIDSDLTATYTYSE